MGIVNYSGTLIFLHICSAWHWSYISFILVLKCHLTCRNPVNQSSCSENQLNKNTVFLRKRTAAAPSRQRPLQLPTEACGGSGVLAPPRGQSDDIIPRNIDTVAAWWTLTGTLSPCFSSFNHLHESTQAPLSTNFICNQTLKRFKVGRADRIKIFYLQKGR